jgi:hypothetical protein
MEEKEIVIKKELKLKYNNSIQKWEVLNAKGFYPEQEMWSKEELRQYTRENEEIKLNLVY